MWEKTVVALYDEEHPRLHEKIFFLLCNQRKKIFKCYLSNECVWFLQRVETWKFYETPELKFPDLLEKLTTFLLKCPPLLINFDVFLRYH